MRHGVLKTWKQTNPHEAHRRKLSVEQPKLRCLPRHFAHKVVRYVLPSYQNTNLPFPSQLYPILLLSYHLALSYLIYLILSILFYSGCMHSTAASAVPTNLCNSIRNTTGFTQKHTQWQRHSSRMWCVSKWIPTRVHTGCHLSFMGKKTRLLKIYSHSQLLSSLREHGRLQSNRMAGVQKDKRKAMWVDRICYYRPQSREHGPASQGVQKARRPWQKPKGGAAPAGWAPGADGAAVLSNPVHVWNKLWSCDMPVTCQ